MSPSNALFVALQASQEHRTKVGMQLMDNIWLHFIFYFQCLLLTCMLISMGPNGWLIGSQVDWRPTYLGWTQQTNHWPCPLTSHSCALIAGRNFTPAQLPAHVRRKLTALCDDALLRSVRLFPNCTSLVGVGRFAEERIKAICSVGSLPHQQRYLLHPSPQNPKANKSWTPIARKNFEELGILPPLPKQEAGSSDCDHVLESGAVKRKLFQTDAD